MPLMVGCGRVDITPAPGTPHAGWGAQTHQRGEGADLPLYATALYLSDGAYRAAIVDIDTIGLDALQTSQVLEAAEKLTGIPRGSIRLAGSHGHSGPNTFRFSLITEGRDMIDAYLRELPFRVAGAIWQARNTAVPARCGAGRGTCDINLNRRLKLDDGRVVVGRNRDGPADRTVRVVRFDDEHGNVVAAIVHYSCHPTIMGWANRVFCPDFPGVVRRVVEEQTGGTCLFLQGAAGGIGPRRGFTADLSVYRRLGTILGLEAARVALGVEAADAAVLAVRSLTVPLPVRRLPPAEELERELASLRANLPATSARAAQVEYKANTARRYAGMTHIPWQLQVMRIGCAALVSVPGEPSWEIGREIASISPFEHTLFSGYSNGGFGYLPLYDVEQGGYEMELTAFSADAARVLIEAAAGVLREMASA